MRRFAVIASAGAIVVAAVVVGLGPIAQASTGPGALDCPTLAVYNPTHYGLQVGATVTCTIDNSGVADGSVVVIIQSSNLGNTTLTGTASGGTITFTYTAPANGCNTGVVAYGAPATLADNSVINGGSAAAGFAFVDANGALINTCVTASPSPSSSPSHSPGPNLSVLSASCGSVTIANLPTGDYIAITPGTVVETANGTFPLAAGGFTWIEYDAFGAEAGNGTLVVAVCPTPSPSPGPSPTPEQSPGPSPSPEQSPGPSPSPGTSPSPSPSPEQSPSPSPTPGTSPSPSPTPGTSTSPSPSPSGGVLAANASPAGGVLAATGGNTPAQGLALFLVAFGLFAVVGGALAWRRRRT